MHQTIMAGALAVLPLIAASAEAAVVFEFRQTSTTPAHSPAVMNGWIAFSDAAFATGINFQATEWTTPQVNWAAVGIEGLFFGWGIGGIGPGHFAASLSDLVPQPGFGEPGYLNIWSLQIGMAPHSTPNVDFYFNDTGSDFHWHLGEVGSHVTFNTDGEAGACFVTNECWSYGDFVRVPEPASAGFLLLGAGLLWRISTTRRLGRANGELSGRIRG